MASLPLTEDYYAILEVNQDADMTAIKSSYKRLAMLKHPDKAGQRNTKKATADFQLLSQAYTTLSNQDTRRSYDLVYSSIPRFRRDIFSTHNVRTSQSQQSSDASSHNPQASSPSSGTSYTETGDRKGQRFAQEERNRHEKARAEAAKRAADIREMEKRRAAQRDEEAAEFRRRAEQARKEAEERRAEHRQREEEERRRHIAQREKDLLEKQRQAQLEREQAMQEREDALKKKEQTERQRRIGQQTERLEQLQITMIKVCNKLAITNMKLNMLQNQLNVVHHEIEKSEKVRKSWKAHLMGFAWETQAEKTLREYKEEQLAMSAIIAQDKVDEQLSVKELIMEEEEAIKKEISRIQCKAFLEKEIEEGIQEREEARKVAEEYERLILKSERAKKEEGEIRRVTSEKRRYDVETQAADAARIALENARLRALADEVLQTRLKAERAQYDRLRQCKEFEVEFERRRANEELIAEMHRMAEEERQRTAGEEEYLRRVAAEEERLRLMQIHVEERKRRNKAERDRLLQLAAEREMSAAAERLKRRDIFEGGMKRTARTACRHDVFIMTHGSETYGHSSQPIVITRINRRG